MQDANRAAMPPFKGSTYRLGLNRPFPLIDSNVARNNFVETSLPVSEDKADISKKPDAPKLSSFPSPKIQVNSNPGRSQIVEVGKSFLSAPLRFPSLPGGKRMAAALTAFTLADVATRLGGRAKPKAVPKKRLGKKKP